MSSLIPFSKEWPVDLSSVADLNREVLATYRNGEKEKVKIVSSNFQGRIRFSVSFNARDRAMRNSDTMVLRILNQEKTVFISNFYEKDGRVNNHPVDLADHQFHDRDIVAISLRLDELGQDFATPCENISSHL